MNKCLPRVGSAAFKFSIREAIARKTKFISARRCLQNLFRDDKCMEVFTLILKIIYLNKSSVPLDRYMRIVINVVLIVEQNVLKPLEQS